MRHGGLPEGADLERWLEEAEQHLYADLHAALPPGLAGACGIEARRDGGELRLTLADHDHAFFNRVMGLGLGPPCDAAHLRAVARHYEQAGIRRWMVQVLPHVEAEVRPALEAQGLVRLRGWAKHVAPVGHVPPTPSDLRVERIGRSDADAWADVVGDGFGIPAPYRPWMAATVGRPGWWHYLALDGDVAVASAALYVREGLGTLGFAATRESHRRRGAQSALIARRLGDLREAGGRWVASETDEDLPGRPNPSTHNVVRLGLPVAYVRANWGPPRF